MIDSQEDDYLKIIEQKGKCVKTGSPRIDIAIENNTKRQLIKNKKKILICLNHNLFWKRDFFERLRKGENPFVADKIHFHYLLNQK